MNIPERKRLILNEKLTVLVTLQYESDGRKRLEAKAPENNYIYLPPSEVTPETVSQADIIIGNVPVDTIVHAKRLRWFQSQMAGVDPYLKDGVIPENVIITNVTGAFGAAVSEHMVGTVFELYKKLHYYRDNQNKCEWLDRGFVREVEGSTVCVIGLGDIGGAFAKKMKALGCYTIGIKRRRSEKPDYIDELYTMEMLDSVIGRADITALALPDTVETRGLFSRERIGRIKNGSVLINVGRGNAVDTEALCDALDNGQLYGASLDVFENEPLPASHRLWKTENAVITPHISGFFHMRRTYDTIIDICTENYGRFVSGKDLMNIIDKKQGYVC